MNQQIVDEKTENNARPSSADENSRNNFILNMSDGLGALVDGVEKSCDGKWSKSLVKVQSLILG